MSIHVVAKQSHRFREIISYKRKTVGSQQNDEIFGFQEEISWKNDSCYRFTLKKTNDNRNAYY